MDSPYPVLELTLASSRLSRSSSEGDKRNKAINRRHGTIAYPEEDKTCKQRHKPKMSNFSSSSSMSLYALSPSSERDSLPSASKRKTLKVRLPESKLPLLLTVENHYPLAVAFRTYRLSSRLQRYDDIVSSYVAKFAKMAELQMKAYFFDPKKKISIFGFLATFELACDTNKIQEGAATGILSHFVK